MCVVYKITIRINQQDIVFTTSTYSYNEDKSRISFRDKFNNKKEFSTDSSVLIGVEEAGSNGY
jgi:hypothetical protein